MYKETQNKYKNEYYEAQPEADDCPPAAPDYPQVPPSNLLMGLLRNSGLAKPSFVMPISPLTHEPMFKL